MIGQSILVVGCGINILTAKYLIVKPGLTKSFLFFVRWCDKYCRLTTTLIVRNLMINTLFMSIVGMPVPMDGTTVLGALHGHT